MSSLLQLLLKLWRSRAPSSASSPASRNSAGTRSSEVLSLSDADLAELFPHLGAEMRAKYLPLLLAALAEFEVNTPARVAAFLAQVGHESGEFRWMSEFSDGHQYEGRADLGNTQPGDGPRYKGRSPIMLTGRANYAKAGHAL